MSSLNELNEIIKSYSHAGRLTIEWLAHPNQRISITKTLKTASNWSTQIRQIRKSLRIKVMNFNILRTTIGSLKSKNNPNQSLLNVLIKHTPYQAL